MEPTAEIQVLSYDPNVEIELTQEDVYWVFSEFGAVKSVQMTGSSRGIVKMDSYKELHKAVSFLNFRKLQSDAQITVKWVFDNAKAV